MDLHDSRTDYTLDKLSRKDLETSPVSQFKKWFEEVSATGFRDPSAMIVATVDFLERQVRIQGQVELLDRASVETYFHSRPQGSQLAAASSNQSAEIDSRAELENSFNSLSEQYGEDQKIPLPERWGGYRVIPSSFEFWQGGENRLHDRFSYTLKDENWDIQRLQP